MEVKRICQWCGKPFIAKKTTTCYCSPQCSKRGYKHRMMERKMELRHMQEMLELRSSLEKQEYFTFSQAAPFDGRKPPVHLQTGQGGETPRIAAHREDVVDTAGRHRAHAQKHTL